MKKLRFLPKRLHNQLIANKRYKADAVGQLYPVIKLFTADDNSVWLFGKVMHDNHKLAYGLIDMATGNPHMGYIDLEMLSLIRCKYGLPVERDVNFKAEYPLEVYYRAACFVGKYTEDPALLSMASKYPLTPRLITPRPSLN